MQIVKTAYFYPQISEGHDLSDNFLSCPERAYIEVGLWKWISTFHKVFFTDISILYFLSVLLIYLFILKEAMLNYGRVSCLWWLILTKQQLNKGIKRLFI